MNESIARIADELAFIASELRKAVDGDYGVYITPNFQYPAVNEIAMMTNFLLNAVNQSIQEKEEQLIAFDTSISQIVTELEKIKHRAFQVNIPENTPISSINYLAKHVNELSEEIKIKTISSHYFEMLFNNTPVPLLICTPSLEITRYNQKASKLLKLKAENPKPFTLEPFITELFDTLKQDLRKAKHQLITIEKCNLKNTDEITFPVSLSLVPISQSDTSQDQQEILITLIDLTKEERRAQEKAIFYKQIYDAKRMESIATLSSGIAHDFNNILNIALGYIDLLKQGSDISKQANYINQIESALHNGTGLISSMLDFVHPDSDRKTTIIDMNSLIVTHQELLAKSLSQNIVITYDLSAHDANISLSQAEAISLLINLLTNAKKAIQDKGYVNISTENFVSDGIKSFKGLAISEGAYVLLKVRDTGIGISNETIDKIFDPFFTTKLQREGHGLGLASMYQIIQKYKGYVHVESTLNVGTTFYILLPKTHTQSSNASASTPAALSPNILFVDDNNEIRAVFKELLEGMGATVHPASDGQEALIYYKKHTDDIDIVISDMVMPKMTGIELCKNLYEINPDVHVILCTGHMLEETSDVLQFSIKKSLSILQKPVPIKKIWKIITNMLDERRSTRE